jgi:hypothetical protein
MRFSWRLLSRYACKACAKTGRDGAREAQPAAIQQVISLQPAAIPSTPPSQNESLLGTRLPISLGAFSLAEPAIEGGKADS